MKNHDIMGLGSRCILSALIFICLLFSSPVLIAQEYYEISEKELRDKIEGF